MQGEFDDLILELRQDAQELGAVFRWEDFTSERITAELMGTSKNLLSYHARNGTNQMSYRKVGMKRFYSLREIARVLLGR